jgi:hypothetical protein
MISEMRNKLKNSIDWMFDKSNSAVGLLGFAFSVIDISNIDDWKIGEINFPIGNVLYWICCILCIIFCVISFLYGKEIDKLEKENANKSQKIRDLESSLNNVVNDTNDLFKSYLRLLIRNLNFSHTERISMYKVYNDKFKLIGRTSENPTLEEEGRKDYPIDEGFIGKGWAERDFFIDDLPDPSNKSYYNRINTISKIPRQVVDNIKMKSRTYFVYRINGYDSSPKAVLVFESLKEKAFQKEFIIEKLKDVKLPLIIFTEKNNGVVAIENNMNI